MTRACVQTVHDATGRVFSDAEVDDIINRVADRAVRAKRAAPNLSEQAAIHQAMREVTTAELRQQLIEKRTAMAAEAAREVRRPELEAMSQAGLTEAQALDALNVGAERQAPGAGASVDAEGRARQMSLWGQVQIGLNQMPGLMDRMANFWGVGERGFDRLVAKEMARLNGAGDVEPTGDEAALHAARVFVAAMRAGREAQNAVGAWIDELPGYIARQSHDAEKIAGGYWRELAQVRGTIKETGKILDPKLMAKAEARAEAKAFAAWRDFIRPRLDDRTFAGLGPDSFDKTEVAGWKASGRIKNPDDLSELMLHSIFMDILTGRHQELTGMDDLGDFRPPASRARQVSEARVLHFKSPDDWADYNEKFGRSSLYSAVMGQLERGARNTALMRRWGPNPGAAWEAEVSRLAQNARARGDVAGVRALDNWKIRNGFDQVNGGADAPQNVRLASTMRNVRNWEAMTKLGGIILSKTTDMVLSGATMARAGGGFLAGYRGWFEGIAHLGGEEARHAADLMDVGARSFANHLTGQFHTADGPAGWGAWGVNLMYRINGFDFMNEGVREGMAMGLARHFGSEADKAWEGLRIGTRETFERFGITPEDWEAARGGQMEAADGKTYWGMDRIEDPATALKFRVMIHDLLDNATGESRARERRAGSRGTRPGTALGEFMRSFLQFKGFVNSVVGRQLVPAARGYAGMAPVATLAHLIIGSALAGYVSMNAKQLAGGQVPRGPIGKDLAETVKIWSASLAQGGGLGIYGDFLFGEQNRNGGDFSWSQLGGPLLSDSEQIAKVVQQSLAGGEVNERTGKSPLPGELVRLGSRNIPLVNLWYTRLALDYLVLWRLQEAVSPGYLQRYQSRVENQEGRHFILAPTSAQ